MVGDGDSPNKLDKVSIEYTGMIAATGEQFDTSSRLGKPLKFPIDDGAVIPGWNEGVRTSKAATFGLALPARMV